MSKLYFLLPCEALSFTGAFATVSLLLWEDWLFVSVGQVTCWKAWMRLNMWLKSAWPALPVVEMLAKALVWQPAERQFAFAYCV